MIVRPIKRHEAAQFCLEHPHAPSLPKSSAYYFAAFEKCKFIGLAVWGWGIVPKRTPIKLFGKGKLTDYLELNRFFVVDDADKNTPSKFLSITHKILKKYLPKLKYLTTYAAGFQGLVGTIYQAAGYDYIGKQKVSFYWLPNKGLIHNISLWHRYSKTDYKFLIKKLGNVKKLNGYNFCYIYFLRDKERLLKMARFKILPYPKKEEIKIWDESGNIIEIEVAKKIPLLKLRS